MKTSAVVLAIAGLSSAQINLPADISAYIQSLAQGTAAEAATQAANGIFTNAGVLSAFAGAQTDPAALIGLETAAQAAIASEPSSVQPLAQSILAVLAQQGITDGLLVSGATQQPSAVAAAASSNAAALSSAGVTAASSVAASASSAVSGATSSAGAVASSASGLASSASAAASSAGASASSAVNSAASSVAGSASAVASAASSRATSATSAAMAPVATAGVTGAFLAAAMGLLAYL